MFDFDTGCDPITSPAHELLAEIGLTASAIRDLLDEPAPFDPRGGEEE